MLFLLFHLGAARYALETAAVREIVPSVELKPLFGAPSGVAGLLDYHGAPVPVLDLCVLTTGQPTQARFSSRLILVRLPVPGGESAAGAVVGLLAERATSLLQREPGDWTATGLHVPAAPFLGSVTVDAEGFIHRVNVPALLTGPARDWLTHAVEDRLLC